MSAQRVRDSDPYAGTGLPELGLRNYWYPVLAEWRLGRRPKALRVLGEDIVVFRDRGRLYALGDRCPHRGARLSQGRCLYPGTGTITCPYHGWTFAGETGGCVAKLMEGPDAPMSRRPAVKSYPVRALRGDLGFRRRHRGAAARRRRARMPGGDGRLARLRDMAHLSLQLAHHEGQSVPRPARAVRAPQRA